MELLLPEVGQDLLIQQALANSARDLSIDERYVLRKLASVVAFDPAATSKFAGVLITVPVAEFGAHAGITQKVASRRLDVATYALLTRWVRLDLDDGCVTQFCWAESRQHIEGCFELRFSGHFIRYLLQATHRAGNGVNEPLLSFAAALNAPVMVAYGGKVPAGLEIVLVSRLKARTKRRKVLTWEQVTDRVAKRLKKVHNREVIEDAIWVADQNCPRTGAYRPGYQEFNHRDIDRVYAWVIANLDKPDFLEV